MAHKTFISYKFSEAQKLRDDIILALGSDASFYQGETADSPDMTDLKTTTIKKHLTDMMFDTSVTIVVLSPKMKQSKWIDWELEYSLSLNTRKERTSHRNGVVAVIQKVDGGYNWLKEWRTESDGCRVAYYKTELLYDIINKNRFNQVPEVFHCEKCKCKDRLSGSYISIIEEEEFLQNPQLFIDNAYDKSENDGAGYEVHSKR